MTKILHGIFKKQTNKQINKQTKTKTRKKKEKKRKGNLSYHEKQADSSVKAHRKNAWSELALKDIFQWVTGVSAGCRGDPMLSSYSMRACYCSVAFNSQNPHAKTHNQHQ